MENVKLCPECNHVLYPREDKVKGRLVYACNQCSYQVPVERNIIFMRKYPVSITNESTVKKTSPVLPYSKGVQCVKCKFKEVTFFQSVVKDDKNEEPRLVLYLVCSSSLCGHRWRGSP